MRVRLVALAVLALCAAGCATAGVSESRPIPVGYESHRVEPINTTATTGVRMSH